MNESVAHRITVTTLLQRKREGVPITMLTAYDASLAAQVDAAGLDSVLVGDSLGNVIQGHDTTLPVTVDDMVYHVACVRRGVTRALLIADLPFLSYASPDTAVDSAGRLMRAGAEMVKLEGGEAVAPIVSRLTAQGIPVCAHLGLTPQHVHVLGGMRVQARAAEAADRLVRDAVTLAEAGAALLVLECVPRALGARVTGTLDIPVIGIGAGAEVDGQVLVLYDMLGITPGKRPRFSHDFLAATGSVPAALAAYVSAVTERRFPGPEHSFD